MTKVKICGLSTPAAVAAAVKAGADYIGFVFAESRRQVSPAQARELAAAVPSSVQKVGVFVSPTLAELDTAVRTAGLDAVQIHGQMSAELADALPVPLIRALSAEEAFSSAGQETADFLLFDAPVSGSGQTFDWQALDTDQLTQPFFIAGGLTADNVREAIRHFSPYAVDVSSGVETDGKKDSAKIKQFIERVQA